MTTAIPEIVHPGEFALVAQAYLSVAKTLEEIPPEDRDLLVNDEKFRYTTLAPFWPWPFETWQPSLDPATDYEKAAVYCQVGAARLHPIPAFGEGIIEDLG